jgi:hypothetical protein
MNDESIKIDDQGIPILDQAVDPVSLPANESVPEEEPVAEPLDREQIEALLKSEQVQTLLDDLTEDLQKLVTWKMESFLKEELGRLVHEAAQLSAPRLSRDIHTELELALPELLTNILRKS